MDEQQQRVKDWMARYGLGTDPQARMLDLSSEVGELAKEVLKSTAYGTRSFTPTASLEEELGDCLFSLLCLSQCLGLEGEAALGKALEKYEALCRKGHNRPPDVRLRPTPTKERRLASFYKEAPSQREGVQQYLSVTVRKRGHKAISLRPALGRKPGSGTRGRRCFPFAEMLAAKAAVRGRGPASRRFLHLSFKKEEDGI